MSDAEKKPASEFDAYSTSYNDVVNSSIAFSGLKVDFFTRAKAERIAELIASHYPGRRDVRVLDIGCGVGNYHPFLIDRCGTIEGVDVSAESIETAKRNNPTVRYQAYDGHRLPFDDASFDVAYTICVMHHVPPADWPAFSAEMFRVLKPGGLALVFEHNPLNPLTRHVVSNCEFDANAVLLKSGKTQELLGGAGFDGVASRFILTIPAAGGLMQRIDSLFERVPLGAQYYSRGVKP